MKNEEIGTYCQMWKLNLGIAMMNTTQSTKQAKTPKLQVGLSYMEMVVLLKTTLVNWRQKPQINVKK